MQAGNVIVLFSEEFHQLKSFFQNIQPPYTLENIGGFNSIYKRIYPLLNRDEKRRSEEFVDIMIDNLERKEWAAKIFGVV
ncbi:hypothetical protein [Methylocaldum sp.]|uniref:hypothetical protein n=1 Tax=Methylocaldum sp. TaxID=1969727 RepID=UPI002D3AFFD8|nr:hypothetical protein [Methylocaldum sp.]HYE37973.1 hypothetical protein [Methylocaldum sp.]